MKPNRQSNHTTIQEAQDVLRTGNTQEVLRVLTTLNPIDKTALVLWGVSWRKAYKLTALDVLRGDGVATNALLFDGVDHQDAVLLATITQARAIQDALAGIDSQASDGVAL